MHLKRVIFAKKNGLEILDVNRTLTKITLHVKLSKKSPSHSTPKEAFYINEEDTTAMHFSFEIIFT